MADNATHSPEYAAAIKAQRQAANPSASRLASANAGSGKTRVLVDRVSRILLQDVPPEKILCLTYTKAAASEMQSRLFKVLGSWSIMGDEDLNAVLTKLMGRVDHDVPLKKARQLFAKALETPEGLKVQTIHAFCERILARFPIEAGILPGFEPIDEAEMKPLRESVRDEIYKVAAENPAGELNQALRILTSAKAEQTLDELFKWMSFSSEKIKLWEQGGGIEALAEFLDIDLPYQGVDELKAYGWDSAPKSQITQAATEMLTSSVKDVERAEQMLASFTIKDSVKAWENYSCVFLNSKQSGPLKSIVTQKAGEFAQLFFSNDPKDGYDSERERVLRLVDKIKSTECLVLTEAFFVIAREFSKRFKASKQARRGLDFSDQIILVRDLLCRSEVSDWIRYKLDGGVEHVLLDEAQDTSPEQWQIINALSEAFEQDSPDRDPKKPRTLFAVGDEKQSIYSFQGAEPERFLGEIQKHSAGDASKEIRMKMSFRSAPQILQFVDQIFVEDKVIQQMFDAESYAPASDLVRHTANRDDTGQIDLWPAVDRPEIAPDKEPWDTSAPVDAMGKFDAREQLAQAIASQIDNWIKNKTPIFDREMGSTRPINAGDVLILVRQRNNFFNAVIRNLKAAGVAVAGADRLKLKDAIVIKDLLSLARFTLLPSDNLSLAELLKSPLFGFDDDALFDVAKRRGDKSLWQALQDKRPAIGGALKEIIGLASLYAPYEFFTRVLDMKDGQGSSLKRRVFARLGLEAKDAVEAFLARALAHQRQSSPSLQHFVQSFAGDEQELKRDMDGGSGEVRVMTVHGSKGLEAPIVFLPDTTQKPTTADAVIKVENGFALAPSANKVPEKLTACKDAAKDKRLQENLRLFYVALTRAESRLIICGYKTGHKKGTVQDGSWYTHAQKAFESLDSSPIDTPFGEGQSFGPGAKAGTVDTKVGHENKASLPPWISSSAPAEGIAKRRVTPSHLLAPLPNQDMPVRSPLSQDSDTRFARGNLIHKLLEILPEFASEKRGVIAAKILASEVGLSDEQREQISDEVFAVLDNPDFANIFAPNSRAEISLAGSAKTLPPDIYLNAQIDRISVTQTHVYIIDYKSNRPPPKTQDGVADIYWGQMAAYRELAKEIYPGREIISALLWTDGPSLMVLDDKRLDAALTQIASLLT